MPLSSRPRRILALLLFATAMSRCLPAQQGTSGEHLQRARDLLKAGSPVLAATELEAVLVTDPTSVEAQGNLGVLRFFSSGCTQAMPHLEAALAIDASAAQIRALVGICQKRSGNTDAAEQNLRTARKVVTNPKILTLVLTNLTEIAYGRGDLEEASATINTLIKSDPNGSDTLYLAYRIYTDLAEAARNTLTVLDPDSARVHQLMAQRYINQGDATMAIGQYQLALEKDPSLPGLHYELGEAILLQSATEESRQRASQELRQALAEDPSNAGAEAKLGTIEAITGHAQLARQRFMRALSLNKDEFNALVGLADILRTEGKTSEAAEYLRHAVRMNPMDDSLYYRLAQLDRQLGRKADADREIRVFTEIRNLNSKVRVSDQQRTAP